MSAAAPSADVQRQAAHILELYTRRLSAGFDAFGFADLSHRPDDVFITSFLKTGTTLMQQIVYQMLCAFGRVPADPAGDRFSNISRVVPTIELRNSLGVREPVNCMRPRAWKSHGTPADFAGPAAVPPAHGAFIYCVRDGRAVARSFLDFTLDWIVPDRDLTDRPLRAEMYRQWFLAYFLNQPPETTAPATPEAGHEHPESAEGGGGGKGAQPGGRSKRQPGPWFAHMQQWLNADRRVYFAVYEDVVADLPATVRAVAKFLRLDRDEHHPLTDAVVQRVARKCSRDAMAADPRFQDTMVSDAFGWDPALGIRVRRADMPGFKDFALDDQCVKLYDDALREFLHVDSYTDIVEALRRRNAELLRK